MKNTIILEAGEDIVAPCFVHVGEDGKAYASFNINPIGIVVSGCRKILSRGKRKGELCLKGQSAYCGRHKSTEEAE